jgi:hypothetical protein
MLEVLRLALLWSILASAGEAGLPAMFNGLADDSLIETVFVRRANTDAAEPARLASRPPDQLPSSATCNDPASDCLWYVALPWENQEFQVVLQLKVEADSLQLLGVGTARCDPLSSRRVFTCGVKAEAAGTQTWQIVAHVSPNRPPEFRRLYVARSVDGEYHSAASGCTNVGICINRSGITDLKLRITNFAEVDREGSEAPSGFGLRFTDQQPSLAVDSTAAGRSQRITLKTRRPFIAQNQWTDKVTNVVTFVSPPPNVDIIRFGSDARQDTSVLVGEQLVTTITNADGAKVKVLYELRQQVGGEATVVAYMQFLGNKLARINGVKATARSPRESSPPLVTAHVSGSTEGDPEFAAQLRVRETPLVRKVVIQQLEAYTDTLLHRGSEGRVVLEGSGLDIFTSYRLEELDHPLKPVVFSSNVLSFDVQIPASVSAPHVSLLLKSEIVPDTLIRLPVAQASRPRVLDFGWIVANDGGELIPGSPVAAVKAGDMDLTPAKGSAPRPNLKSSPKGVQNDEGKLFRRLDSSVVLDLGDRELRDLWLMFDPKIIDSGSTHGVQYLEVIAELSRPKFMERAAADYKEVLAIDTARIAIVPPGGRYDVVDNYPQENALSIDRLLNDVLRDAPAKSRLELTVRHDPSRYGSIDGHSTKVTVRDDRKWRWDFNLQLPSGLFTMANKRSVQRTLIANGLGTDSLVSGDASWRAALAAMVGAASIDVTQVKDNGRPGLYRGRFSLYYMQSPFTETNENRFAVAAQYPLHLFSAGFLQASIAFGPACMMASSLRCFYILAPGFTVGEAQ